MIVRAIGIEIAGAKDTLATKQDLLGLRREVSKEISDLRSEMREMRGELRAEIHARASSVTRQMCAALLGRMAVLLGFAYFFTTRLR